MLPPKHFGSRTTSCYFVATMSMIGTHLTERLLLPAVRMYSSPRLSRICVTQDAFSRPFS